MERGRVEGSETQSSFPTLSHSSFSCTFYTLAFAQVTDALQKQCVKTKFNLSDLGYRQELLATGDALAKSKKVNCNIVEEIKACLRACRANPDHAGNWESLVEEIGRANEK